MKKETKRKNKMSISRLILGFVKEAPVSSILFHISRIEREEAAIIQAGRCHGTITAIDADKILNRCK